TKDARAVVKSGDEDCAAADHAAGATGAGRSSSHPQAVPAMAATRHPMRAEPRRTRWGREMLTLRVLPAEAEAPHVFVQDRPNVRWFGDALKLDGGADAPGFSEPDSDTAGSATAT